MSCLNYMIRLFLTLAIALVMLNSEAIAQFKGTAKLPRSTIDGKWRIVSVDQSALATPISSYYADSFGPAYLPIGTIFTFKMMGAWGEQQPTWMILDFAVHKPIPKEVCPPVPFADKAKNRFYHPLCTSTGFAWDRDNPATGEKGSEIWEISDANLEMYRIMLDTPSNKNKIGPKYSRSELDQLARLGVHTSGVLFAGASGAWAGLTIFSAGKDRLVLQTQYYGTEQKTKYAERKDKGGTVFFIAERVK